MGEVNYFKSVILILLILFGAKGAYSSTDSGQRTADQHIICTLCTIYYEKTNCQDRDCRNSFDFSIDFLFSGKNQVKINESNEILRHKMKITK